MRSAGGSTIAMVIATSMAGDIAFSCCPDWPINCGGETISRECRSADSEAPTERLPPARDWLVSIEGMEVS